MERESMRINAEGQPRNLRLAALPDRKEEREKPRSAERKTRLSWQAFQKEAPVL
jgi:hypothetical protein